MSDLDRLLADLDGLPTEAVPEAIGQLETAKAKLWGRLMVPAPTVPALDDPETTVDVHGAARLLGMSQGWLYRNARRLPFTRRVGTRSLRFSVAGIRRYLASRRPA
jgi:predicted DNA-binding transcriptional regulator AlpA